MRAYALMRHPSEIDAAYELVDLCRKYPEYVAQLHRTLPMPTAQYRGIGRFPFNDSGDAIRGWVDWPQREKLESGPCSEAAASKLLEEYLGPPRWEDGPRPYLEDREEFHAVCALLTHPERYEPVEICRPPTLPKRLLGFDVGYWGGDYSVLCDAAIWPMWHPAPDEALPVLASFTAKLNCHGLFPSARLAEAYLAWYREQPWAETESDDYGFHVVAVGKHKLPKPPASQ